MASLLRQRLLGILAVAVAVVLAFRWHMSELWVGVIVSGAGEAGVVSAHRASPM